MLDILPKNEGDWRGSQAKRAKLDERIRSVSQVTFEVVGKDAFEACVRKSVEWMRGRNQKIPSEAANGVPFDIGGGGDLPAKAVVYDFDSGRVWAGILDVLDTSVVGRTWVTEITIAESGGRVHFGSRLLNVTRGEDVYFHPTLPNITKDIVNLGIAESSGVPISSKHVEILRDDDLDYMLSVIEDPYRSIPVVVVTQSSSGFSVAEVDRIAHKLCGAAHVFNISPEIVQLFTKKYGRFSVFGGGARVYSPEFDIESDDPYDHRLWIFKDESVDRTNSICAYVIQSSVLRLGRNSYPRFEEIRQASAARALKSERNLHTEKELMRMYEEENARLEKEIRKLRNEIDAWIDEFESERIDLNRKLNEVLNENYRYRTRFDSIKYSSTSSSFDEDVFEPLTDYKNFSEWLSKNISPNVWVSSKAIKEMEKNCNFSDPKLIGETIKLLDDYYVKMKLIPGVENRKLYRDKLVGLGLSDQPCFANRSSIKNYPEYSVVYNGDKLWCEDHIKYGGGTDPRKMFRIYYCWSDEDRKVIVGHMPTHLDNTLTN